MSNKIVFVFIFIVLSSFVYAQNYVQLGSDLGEGSPYVKLGVDPELAGNNVTNYYNNTNISYTYNFINETANYTLINATIDIKISNYNESWWDYIIGLFDNYFTKTEINEKIINNMSYIHDFNTTWVIDTANSTGLLTNWSQVNDTQMKLDYLCSTDGKILKRIAGEWVCATDQEGSGTANGLNYTKTIFNNTITLGFYIP
jgi:hypothetical protein